MAHAHTHTQCVSSSLGKVASLQPETDFASGAPRPPGRHTVAIDDRMRGSEQSQRRDSLPANGQNLPKKIKTKHKEQVTDVLKSKVWLKQPSRRTKPEGGRRESPPGARMQWSKGQRERVGERHSEQEAARGRKERGRRAEGSGGRGGADGAFLV